MKQYRKIGLSVETDLYNRISQYAEQTTRTLSNAVIHLTKIGLNAQKEEKAK